MGHKHFCDMTDHWWECAGAAKRLADKEPSVCTCHSCRAPLEQGDHGQCLNLVELVACPEHREEQLRRRQEAEKEFAQRASKFGLDAKWAKLKTLPIGAERAALVDEILEWLFGDAERREPELGIRCGAQQERTAQTGN